MSLDKFLLCVEHTYHTGSVSDQILATQFLAQFSQTKHLLLTGLESNVVDVVITSLECLAQDKHAPIKDIIHCFQQWDDSEVKLAALNAIEHNNDSEQAKGLLIDVVCDDIDYWEGEWNDGDDIRLNAARILDNHEINLDYIQASRLLPLLRSDPEPDVQVKLVSVLSRHSLALLKENFAVTRTSDMRMLLKSTPDKITLFKATQHQDLRCQQIAFQRLSQMNSREYLHMFLTGLSHLDPLIRQTSLSTLEKWNYQVDIKHLGQNDLLQEIPIDILSALLSDNHKQQLVNQWQDKRQPPHSITAILQLISSLNPQSKQAQLSRFIPVFYEKFSSLDEATQLDCLNVLLSDVSQTLSLAFIRQQLQSGTCSNSVRRQLIEHLSYTLVPSSQAYLKELIVDLPAIITTNQTERETATTEVPHRQLDGPNDDASTTQPHITSTLDSLRQSAHSKPSTKHARTKRVAIESSSNLALAIEYCQDKQYLMELCSTEKLTSLSNAEFHALVIALRCHHINLTDVETPYFNQSVLDLVLNDDCSNLESIIDWLGTLWIDQHRLQLIASESLPLQVCLVRYTTDETELLGLLKHPYIGIQIAALKQLKQSGGCSHEELVSLILKEPVLYPQISLFDANTVYNVLAEKIQGSPSIALQAALAFLGATDIDMTH
ncbi:hypothetical protein [Vibrio splendidus]|uniref:hypothetical protein n=1 Tax=Vibrio splendidus TaxID=29497 RepID=UPI000C84A7D9|nr:hypothetical protein [Vibrio splendidus]PMG25356.1 hypothetical protein BCU95_11910 [Vibrio splendidus]